MPVASTPVGFSGFASNTVRHTYAAGSAPVTGEMHLIHLGGPGLPVSVTDNAGNVYTVAHDWPDAWAGGGRRMFLVCPSIVGTPTYIDFAFGTMPDILLFGEHVRITGAHPSSPVGNVTHGAANTATPSLSVTTTTANELLIMSLDLAGPRDVTSTGNTVYKNPESNMWDIVVADAGAAGAKTVSASLLQGGSPVNVQWAAGIIAIKGGATGPTDTTITVDSANLRLTGQNVTLTASSAVTLQVDRGVLALQGRDLPFELTVPHTHGQLVLVGQNVNLTATSGGTITVDSGTLRLTGQNVGLQVTGSITITVEAPRLTLNGSSINLIDSGNIVPSWVVGGMYGSSLFKTNYILVVSSTGKTKWKDYIPVKQVVPHPSDIGTTNTMGAVAVKVLTSGTGLVEWRDYIPVVEVTDSDESRWRFDNNGWIPVIAIP